MPQQAHILHNASMRCEICAETGTICSLTLNDDTLQTEFVANSGNLLYPEMKDNAEWLGDWLFRLWDGQTKSWRVERTSASGDVRMVEPLKNGVRTLFRGASSNADGLRSIELTQTVALEDDLFIHTTVRNATGGIIDIGEMSLALMTNTDYDSLFEQVYKDALCQWHGQQQRDWHEKRVFQHLHLSGHGSYVFLQRPKGDFPALLIHPQGDTSVDTAYQMVPGLGSHWGLCFEGPYYLSLYSKAPRQVYGWLQPNEYSRYWFNGHRSLVLGPGEEKTFCLRATPIHDYSEVAQKLYDGGSIAVHAVPGMVAPIPQPIRFSLRCKGGVPKLIPEANNLILRKTGGRSDRYDFELSATQPGQKKIHVVYEGGETNLLFFFTESPKALLSRHASFVAQRQFYDNPLDPYNRHGLFLPYDSQFDTLYLRSEESWQVGGTDEYCFTIAMFLAEKNVHFPVREEIEVVERFVQEGLWRSGVQDPDSFEVIRGLYWEKNSPADAAQGNKWTYERSRSKLRTFNYPLLMDVFFSLYQIASRFGLTTRYSAKDYLRFAWRCAMLWFDLGRNKNNGAPAGATIVEVLDTLKTEMPEGYDQLYPLVARCAKINYEAEYPYGSELYIDQTAHNQLEALMSRFCYDDKLDEVWRITKALRAGMQPSWYKYGNEKRGNVCVWYATPLNSRVLYHGYEQLRDAEMLRWGYAGLASFLTTLRYSGAAYGWFTWWPDRAYFDMRSLDTDMGMYGYYKSAAAYVDDDPDFGCCGYGCEAALENGTLTAKVNDGVGRRVRFMREGVQVNALNEEIIEVSVSAQQVRILTHSVFDGPCERTIEVASGGREVIINGKPGSEGVNFLA